MQARIKEYIIKNERIQNKQAYYDVYALILKKRIYKRKLDEIKSKYGFSKQLISQIKGRILKMLDKVK